MFKKLLVLLLVFAMIFSFAACGTKDQSDENETEAEEIEVESTEPMDGAWEITDNTAVALPEDVQTAFDKALEKFVGSNLTPVAYVADQVVAGTNYMILCEAETVTAEPLKSYQMVIVYSDLDGNAELTTVKDFDLTAYTEGDNTEINAEELAGGWSVPEETVTTSIPDKAKAAFDKAVDGMTGNEIEPLALLGTQVVAGTNYAFICKSTLATQEPVTGIQIVTVYEDLDGESSITNICTVDPTDFNE